MPLAKVAVFVSGRGSNLEALINKQDQFAYRIALVVVSKKEAYAIQIAVQNDIPYLILDKKTFQESNTLLNELTAYQIDYLCLAGFLWKIPSYLIQAYPEKIINIHPSLLPKFGGKGMYGEKVHQAVVDQNEEESGITIHLVNEEYDKGKVLFQAKLKLKENDTASTLAKRILALEHQYLPEVLHKLCQA